MADDPVIAERFQNVVSDLKSEWEKLGVDQESFGKSMEEWSKQDKEKKGLEELRLLQEKEMRNLDLHSKELALILEGIQEKEKSLEVERKLSEKVKEHIKERFLQVSRREKILDLRREELLGKEEELEFKLTLIKTKEKVLGCRNKQLLARENQLELRESILNLKNEEEIDSPNHEECEPSRNKNRKRKAKQMSLETHVELRRSTRVPVKNRKYYLDYVGT